MKQLKQLSIGTWQITASKKSLTKECSTHWHDFYEIEYILSGSGEYRIDGKRYEIRPGMLFFMSPVNFHCVRPENVILYNVMFSESACSATLLSSLVTEPAFCAVRVGEADRPLMEALLAELAASHTHRGLSTALLDSILAKIGIIGHPQKNDTTPASAAMLYILNHFRSNLSERQVATFAGFTPSYFSEIFKKETGIRFKDYLDAVRFDYAKKLILNSDLTITEIATESGFGDYANFIRRFKRRYGLSPLCYRKSGGRQAEDLTL